VGSFQAGSRLGAELVVFVFRRLLFPVDSAAIEGAKRLSVKEIEFTVIVLTPFGERESEVNSRV